MGRERGRGVHAGALQLGISGAARRTEQRSAGPGAAGDGGHERRVRGLGLHDEHHQHVNNLVWNMQEPHVHEHKHPHFPDIHHRHVN